MIDRGYLSDGRFHDGSPYTEAGVGELALRAGDSAAAIAHLGAATNRPGYNPIYFLAAESLAEALARNDAIADAVEVLETAAPERRRA